MEVCKEMQKLRDWLDENEICWEDVSEDFGKGIPSEIDYELWICRTHFEVKGHEISVINGYGTYGGYGLFSKDNNGLLETKRLCGFLSPDDWKEFGFIYKGEGEFKAKNGLKRIS